MIPIDWFKMTKSDAAAMGTPLTYIKWIIDIAKEAGFIAKGTGVESVNGKTGVVVLTTTDINEGTNLYFTDVRALAALVGAPLSMFTNDLGFTTLSTDEQNAIHDANSPNAGNPFATIADITVGSGIEYVPFIATQNLVAFNPVTSNGQLADSSNLTHRNRVIGITPTLVNNGFSGQVKAFGAIINGGWSWTIGDKIYLNGTSLSTVAPSLGFIQIIGTAVGTDTIDVKISQSILL